MYNYAPQSYTVSSKHINLKKVNLNADSSYQGCFSSNNIFRKKEINLTVIWKTDYRFPSLKVPLTLSIRKTDCHKQ
jgi:hypothetical protein